MSALVLFRLRESARTKTKAHRCIHARPFRPWPRRRCHHAAVLLLLCCCFCCSTIRDASRSTIRNADPQCIICRESRKYVPLRCSIFFIWRSGLTRGAGTKNSHSTSPQPLLLWCCCCCCAAGSAAPRSTIHRCSTIRDADPRCIYRDSRKKCSASVFHFLHLAFWFAPGCWDQKQGKAIF